MKKPTTKAATAPRYSAMLHPPIQPIRPMDFSLNALPDYNPHVAAPPSGGELFNMLRDGVAHIEKLNQRLQSLKGRISDDMSGQEGPAAVHRPTTLQDFALRLTAHMYDLGNHIDELERLI